MKTQLSFLAASLTLWAGSALAQQSDFFKVSFGGATLFSISVPEAVAGGSETAVYNVSPFADGLLLAPLPPGVLPLIAAVVMVEPIGEPIDPGEIPLLWPGTNRIVSDIVLNFQSANPQFPNGYAFISDGDGNLQTWTTFLSALPPGVVHLLVEDGTLQDLSPLLASVATVQVMSDVAAVPEPPAAALLLAGAGIVAWAARRRRARD